MKHTYSPGKCSCSKVAATIYGRGIGLSFCKKITEKNEETYNSWLPRDWIKTIEDQEKNKLRLYKF